MSLQKTKKHPNDDYVRRCQLRTKRAKAVLDDFIDKSLPPLPAVPSIPGWTRWLKAITNIEMQMTMIVNEMENYRQYRSKEWKGSMQGYLFDNKLEDLSRITDDVAGWPSPDPDTYSETDPEQCDGVRAHLKRDVTRQGHEGTNNAPA
jgi:hypothetical protein